MKEISNKVLMYVLFVAIVVSVGSTMFSLGKIAQAPSYTGMATTAGDVNLSITSTSIINLTDVTLDFGGGQLNGGYTNCQLDSSDGTQDPPTCGTWPSRIDNMTFENIGSSSIDVKVESGTAIGTFLGGDSPYFSGTCVCTGSPGEQDLGVADTSENASNCCKTLVTKDTGYFTAKVNISANSETDVQSNTLTFAAS